MSEPFELLKKLVGEEVKEELLFLALEEAKEMVKNYCHIETIPAGLSYTMVRMAADLYRNENSVSLEQMDGGSVISSIKVGDTTTSFSSTVSQDREVFQNGLLKNYRSQLNCYRKVRLK